MIELTEQEIAEWKRKIEEMSQYDCLRLQRYAPVEHPIFRRDEPLYEIFKKHFADVGGITPEISKAVGWDG